MTRIRRRWLVLVIGAGAAIVAAMFLAYLDRRSDQLDHEAQTSLRASVLPALAYAQGHDGSFEGLNHINIREIESNVDFRDSRTPVLGERRASILVISRNEFAAAAYGSDRCFFIRADAKESFSSVEYASDERPPAKCTAERHVEVTFYPDTFKGWPD